LQGEVERGEEELAVNEAKRLGITTIAMVDSNSDPTPVDIVIPANDDAIRSIRLIAAGIADAAIAGRLERASVTGEDQDFAEALAAEDASTAESIAGETAEEQVAQV
jgi:small subunit ribosomal protein S2